MTFHKWLRKITIKFGEHETVIFKIILSQLLHNINEMMLTLNV